MVGNSSVEKIWVRFVKPAYVDPTPPVHLARADEPDIFQKLVGWIVGSQAERLTAEIAATSGWREDLNRSIDCVLV